jgi:DNA-binding IclR family transcriptional regulator
MALPQVRALHEQLGETCHLCTPSYLSALCLVHVSKESANGAGPQLRELVPAHATAAGKALLAWRPGWREAVLGQQLRSYTAKTLTGPEYLRRELARTEARGYALEHREYQPETRALAVPVWAANEAVAALAVVAPVERLPVEWDSELVEIVGQAARAISAELV